MNGPHHEYERWHRPASAARRSNKRLQIALGLVGTIFAVVLAAVVGQRLSDQVISVLAGATCGVAASLPTSLLVVWATRRKREEALPGQRQPSGPYPPVVVVQPPHANGAASYQQAYLPPYTQQGPARRFTVVGGETGQATPFGEY
jgi:hypothetical protein